MASHVRQQTSRVQRNSARSPVNAQARTDPASMPAPGLVARLDQDVAQLSSGDVRYLQRTIGNQAVGRLLQGRNQQAGPVAPAVQRMITVGPADDRFEREADRVSQQVAGVRVDAPKPQGMKSAQSLQRRADETGTEPIGPEGGVADSETAGQIRRMQGGGKPIDKVLRAPLEQQLGSDLSHARLHVGAQSDDLNRKVGARAFTTGADIFVQRDEFKPNSRAGRSLLYHEMTHVHQQTVGGQPTLARKSDLIQRNDDDNVDAQEDFSDIGISGHSHRMPDVFEAYYTDKSDKKVQGSKKQALDYMRNLKSKPQDKKARQEQKIEKKQMKQLLHIPRRDAKGMAENERLLLRGFLVAARAQGASVEELSALKIFLFAHHDKFQSGQFKSILNQKEKDIKGYIETAESENASPVVLNFFFKFMPRPVRETDTSVDSLRDNVGNVVQAALAAGKTETDNSMLRVPALGRRLERSVANLVKTRDQGQYYLANKSLGETMTLFGVVQRMAHYAQIRGKTNQSTENELGTAKRLGGGQVSKVYEVNYDPQKQTSITHGVFKQESFSYTEGDSPAAFESGIDTDSANFGGRSVATFEVDKLMGLGMTPETKFATHEGEGGTVQGWAKGNSPQQLKNDSVRYRDFDYSDPEIQRQLATLQLFDVITGQVDRHPGNYYIYQGPEGTQITAIDNDLAFGANKGVDRLIDQNWGRTLQNDQSRGIPLFLDESIAEQILNTSAKDLKQVIQGTLKPAEVDKTLERFAKVKSELKKKKANTARIKFMQRKLDVMTKYQGAFGSDLETVESGLETQINFYRNQIDKLYAQGALIDKSEWGEKTAQHLNHENSYFGLVVAAHSEQKKAGLTIPKDSD